MTSTTRGRTQEYRHAEAFSSLGKDVLLLKRFVGFEQLGRLFHYELDLLSEQPDKVDIDKLLGAPMAVRVDLGDGSPRYFHGLVSQFRQVSGEGELPAYHATVVPWLWVLTRSADCRIFNDFAASQTVPKIVLQVFRDFGASAFRDALTGTYQGLEYCVQYCETAFDFISRLLEREGIYYFFEHKEDGHTLVLADASTVHKPYPGYDQLVYRGRDHAHVDEEHISRWEMVREVQPGAVALGSFDFKQPANDLNVRSSATRQHANADMEVYNYAALYAQRDAGEHYAKVRLDEFQAKHHVITGEANARGIACGSTFKVTGLPEAGDTEYLVTSANYTVIVDPYESGASASGEPPFRCQFTAIPTEQTYRPPRITPRPHIRGPQTATVVGASGDEIHIDEFARIKVHFPWDRHGKADETASCWIRVAQVWAGKKWGTIFTPRVGQEVMVEFLEGDPDRPIITGRVYNGDCKPPYDLPANKTISAMKTLSTTGGGGFNEIRFEDKKGEEQIFIHGEKNQDIRIKNDVYEWVGHDTHLVVVNDQIEEVQHDRQEKIKNDHVEEIGRDHHLAIKGKEAIQVDQSHSFTVKGDVIEVFKANHSEQTTEKYYLKADTIVIEALTHITIKVGQTFIALEASGLSIGTKGTIDLESTGETKIKGTAGLKMEGTGGAELKGATLKLKGDGTAELASPMTTVKGDGMMTVKGGVVMIN